MSAPRFKTITLTLGSTKNGAKKHAIMTLNRPRQRNAISLEMYDETQKALSFVASHGESDGLIVTGVGEYYSSGNDLSNFSKPMHPKTMAKEARELCEKWVNAWVEFPKPIVSAVNGPAIGIAVTTMGLCDGRICSERSTFQTPFKQLAQAPEGCSSYMFPKLMGEKVARQVLDEGITLDAKQAKECGFMDEIVPISATDALYEAGRSVSGLQPHNVYAASNALVVEAAEAALRRRLETEKTPRFVRATPGLLEELRAVNRREVEVLEKAWVSPECFDALIKFLESRKKKEAAALLRVVNKTRILWDR